MVRRISLSFSRRTAARRPRGVTATTRWWSGDVRPDDEQRRNEGALADDADRPDRKIHGAVTDETPPKRLAGKRIKDTMNSSRVFFRRIKQFHSR